MALILDNILTVAQIGAAAHVGTTDVNSNFRDRAITLGGLFMGLNFTGALADANNPFVAASRIEDVILSEDSNTIRLHYFPVTVVTTIADGDGTDLEYTAITDYAIRDIDNSDSDAIRRYTGKLIKRYGKWTKGWYTITYTAGFAAANFPEGIREGLLQIALDLYTRGGDRNVQSMKSFQKSVTYVFNNGVAIPKEAANLLKQFMPVSL